MATGIKSPHHIFCCGNKSGSVIGMKQFPCNNQIKAKQSSQTKGNHTRIVPYLTRMKDEHLNMRPPFVSAFHSQHLGFACMDIAVLL